MTYFMRKKLYQTSRCLRRVVTTLIVVSVYKIFWFDDLSTKFRNRNKQNETSGQLASKHPDIGCSASKYGIYWLQVSEATFAARHYWFS